MHILAKFIAISNERYFCFNVFLIMQFVIMKIFLIFKKILIRTYLYV